MIVFDSPNAPHKICYQPVGSIAQAFHEYTTKSGELVEYVKMYDEIR